MYSINLQGDILQGNEPNTINYDFVYSELENANGQDLEITINTDGGKVEEAFKIYDLLEEYKVLNKAVVTTITDVNCASSGIILLLAGNRRIVNKNTEPFIHKAWIPNKSDVKTSEITETALNIVNNEIANLYAKKTSLTNDEALKLMGENTFLTPEESYSLGFATELSKVYNFKFKPKEEILNKKLNINNMTKDQNDLLTVIKNWIIRVESKSAKLKAFNKVYLTASDEELRFIDVPEDGQPVEGESVAYLGESYAYGEIKMRNGDVFKFNDLGVLLEIDKRDEKENDSDRVEELEDKLTEANNIVESQKNEIENLKTQIENSKKEIEKFNDLASKFEAQNKKEQRKTIETKEDDSFDFNNIRANRKKLRK